MTQARADIFLLIVASLLFVSSGDLNAASLKGQSDEQLLRIMIGGKSERKVAEAAEVETHLPDGFWEMPPQEAALKLVEQNCDLNERQKLRFFIDSKGAQAPPNEGRVGLRWRCSHCYQANHGLTVLRYGSKRSRLLYSRIDALGHPSGTIIRRAVDQTRSILLPQELARQIYETVWWLGKVRFSENKPAGDEEGRVTSGTIISTGDGHGTFWVVPGHPPVEVTFYSLPAGGRYGSEFNNDLHATFASFLLEILMQKVGIENEVTAAVGKEEYGSADQEFVYTQEQPSPGNEARWLDRTIRILRDNKNRFVRESAISNLVSFEQPFRFKDPRIEETLVKILHQTAGEPMAKFERDHSWLELGQVAQALAWRDRSEAFPILLTFLQQRGSESWYGRDDLLEAATILAGRHRELRSAMIDYLKKQFADISASPDSAGQLFDVTWRQDFRELRSSLEKLATSSEDEMEDERASRRSEPPKAVTGRFHDARKILLAWNEADALTRLKLNAIIEASSTHLFGIASFLQTDYDALTPENQFTFREFVAWMSRQKIKYNWQPSQLEVLYSRPQPGD